MANPTNYDAAHICESRLAVVLAGGASRRMGTDKASLSVGGQTVLERTLEELASAGWPLLVLGGDPHEGVPHRPDPFPGEGPLRNLAGLRPTEDWVFVISCDVPRFDRRVPQVLMGFCANRDASVPVIRERAQPLCAIYSRRAIQSLSEIGEERRIQGWLSRLDVRYVNEVDLLASGISPWVVQGANTPEEFAELLAQG